MSPGPSPFHPFETALSKKIQQCAQAGCLYERRYIKSEQSSSQSFLEMLDSPMLANGKFSRRFEWFRKLAGLT